MGEVMYRRGTLADSYTVFIIFEQSLADLSRRFGSTTPASAADPRALQRMWTERRSLYEHLAHTCDQFWLGEFEGRTIGYARSIVRAGVRQLTEMFVLPREQSGGVGRELLARPLPHDKGSRHMSIVASADSRAQALYL
jgi:GNAT superfamily N-acetyltransferase